MDDPRLGDLIVQHRINDPKVVLIGFPSDEGVRRNGGRPGAAEAPQHIRKALYKLTPDGNNAVRFSRLLEHTLDTGDLEVTGDLESDHQRLGNEVAKWIGQGAVPIVLGGGHETAFGHFLGYAESGLDVRILNVDAHADVRPLKKGLAHSGSPFYQALEDPGNRCKKYTVLGLNPWSVTNTHLRYIDSKQGTYCWSQDLTEAIVDNALQSDKGRLMVTLDMDVVDQSAAPGVSAPATLGIKPAMFLYAAYAAGKSPAVSSFDISEVNPRYDVDSRTTRLAALAIWHFLKGLAERV